MLIALVCTFLICVYWVWHQPIQRRTLTAVVMLAVFAGVGYLLYRSPQFSRLVSLSDFLQGNSTRDTSILIRDQMLKEATSLWLQRPFAGWGLDQFRVISAWGTYSHDNYVELLANGGVIGLLLYLGTYVSAFAGLAKSYLGGGGAALRANAFWGMVAVCMLAAWDLAAVSYYEKFNWVVLSVVIGMATVVTSSPRSGEQRVSIGEGGRYPQRVDQAKQASADE
jgi:O-antigen ligase